MTQDHAVGRGAAEEGADSPLTPTEVEASRRPPSEPDPEHEPDTAAQTEDGRGETE
ncbi:hypothetical protein Aab01nite_72510 [Paractinoplanes abujensis]|uniref:Uncharacterized protein n=1 Tax=Paractinoplanes abujensis TaxID=882441 RepID=A0A7W7G5I1_9ACTN|nr:hypothetical protein [Actinoplanes abujensis]MBB4694931.1 hypothetical protein [Actinoplanes abujensis]GID23661.1 hypothetical protein Aab01nite_72510 [Actinoplanes abujensis]